MTVDDSILKKKDDYDNLHKKNACQFLKRYLSKILIISL